MKNRISTFSWIVAFVALVTGTALGQSVWVKDAHNPIMSGGPPGSWYRNVSGPCVLYNTETGTYQMWFTAWASSSTPVYRIGYATSPDGIGWSAPVMVLAPGLLIDDWDRGMVAWQKVIREAGIYKMWYLGAISSVSQPPAIGYATSPDGIAWTKEPGNPVMEPGNDEWEAGGLWGVSIMPDGDVYRMWYSATNSTSLLVRVGYATSSDGINWLRDTAHNPILDVGLPGNWDSGARYVTEVLRCGNEYYMWYAGGLAPNEAWRVGIAVSPDGVNDWDQVPQNPVLNPTAGAWDATFVESGTVMLRDGEFVMWYDGGNFVNPVKIGRATSANITAVAHELQIESQALVVQQNYPNPFNPSTTIEYTLPEPAVVTIEVFDAQGRKVATLLNEDSGAGTHQVRWNAVGAASGVYFCRFEANGVVQTRKLNLVR